MSERNVPRFVSKRLAALVAYVLLALSSGSACSNRGVSGDELERIVSEVGDQLRAVAAKTPPAPPQLLRFRTQLEEAHKNGPSDVTTTVALGQQYVVGGDYRKALALYIDATRLAPEVADPYYAIGNAYYDLAIFDAVLKEGVRADAASAAILVRPADSARLYDATVIRRLREAGAILFAKCNMDEFAFGSSTESSCYGPTYNPWDLERVPGGSSGGSAAAVACEEAVAKRRILLGTFVLSAGYYDAYYLKGQKVRTLIKQDFDRVFEEVDVILTPTAPTPPFKVGEKVSDPLAMYLSDIYTIPVNLAGVPAISLPCGFVEEDGRTLPVGMQLIGRLFGEATLIQAAYAFEHARDFQEMRPAL